jgi:hypothetical protein
MSGLPQLGNSLPVDPLIQAMNRVFSSYSENFMDSRLYGILSYERKIGLLFDLVANAEMCPHSSRYRVDIMKAISRFGNGPSTYEELDFDYFEPLYDSKDPWDSEYFNDYYRRHPFTEDDIPDFHENFKEYIKKQHVFAEEMEIFLDEIRRIKALQREAEYENDSIFDPREDPRVTYARLRKEIVDVNIVLQFALHMRPIIFFDLLVKDNNKKMFLFYSKAINQAQALVNTYEKAIPRDSFSYKKWKVYANIAARVLPVLIRMRDAISASSLKREADSLSFAARMLSENNEVSTVAPAKTIWGQYATPEDAMAASPSYQARIAEEERLVCSIGSLFD